ncbi:hypothetical protein ABIB62_000658 [Mucilaginibacter sp. UYP25]
MTVHFYARKEDRMNKLLQPTSGRPERPINLI